MTQDNQKFFKSELEGKPSSELQPIDENHFILQKKTSLAYYLDDILEVNEVRDEYTAKHLALQVWEGDEKAKEELVLGHLRFPVMIAKNIATECNSLVQDLIQEGNLGLMRAASKYGKKKNKEKFVGYASMWILQHMRRFIHNDSLVRLPTYLSEKIDLISKNSERIIDLVDEHGKLEQLNFQFYSYSESLYEEVIYDSGVRENPLDDNYVLIENIEYSYILDKALSELDSRTKYILQCRFGLNQRDEKTLEELGEELGLTRERIRQLESKGTKRLATILSSMPGFRDCDLNSQSNTNNNKHSFTTHKSILGKNIIEVEEDELNYTYLDQWQDINDQRSKRGHWREGRNIKGRREYITEIIEEFGKMTPKQIYILLHSMGLDYSESSLYQLLVSDESFVKIGDKWDLKKNYSDVNAQDTSENNQTWEKLVADNF